MSIVGDFSFINDARERELLSHDFEVINNTPGAWTALKTHDPEKSFMWDTHGELWHIIRKNMSKNHSGASMALCLRDLECIAKNGWGEYIKLKK